MRSILAKVLLLFGFFGLIGFSANFVSANGNNIVSIESSIEHVLNEKPDNVPGFRTTPGNTESKVNYIIFKIVDVILLAGGSLAVLFIAISGVRFVTAGGSQDMIDGAKRNLQYAVLGLLAVILSWAIVTNVIKVLFTKDESPSADCRALGCTCFSDSECDSGKCSRSGSEHSLGTKDGKSVLKVCQPK